jgi:NADP-dependent aldehyde dehydrogenase
MGSVNPVFVLPGAMFENGQQIAQGLSASVTLGVGQFCTNPGLVISESDNLVTYLESAFSQAHGGVMLSENIRNAFEDKTGKMIQTEGVELLASGDNGSQVTGMVFHTSGGTFLKNPHLSEEVFGPSTIHVKAQGKAELLKIAQELEGHLTATIHGTKEDLENYSDLVHILERKAGRLIFNGFPTGVEVCHAMHHGGPYPATTAPQTTSVGTMAIYRFTRPVCFQDFPGEALPHELKDANPGKIMRLVNGEYTTASI